MVKLQHFSLPNLLADKALVPELLQDAVTVAALVSQMQPLLGVKGQDTYQDFVAIHQQIRCDASATAAQAVAALLETSSAGTPQ
jgi:lipid-A-disaccharide synthase